MHAVSVPAHPGALRDADGVAQAGWARGDAVDELGDGRVEAEELIEGGGEDGELGKVSGGGVGDAGGEDFGAKSSLEGLVGAELPEDGIEELLGVFVGGEEGDFEVGAVLGIGDLAVGESVFEGVDQEVGFRTAWVAGAVARAGFDKVVEEIFEFFHNVEGALAGGEDVRIFVQGREVEEEGFEDCFLDDGLEFFDAGVGLFEALLACERWNNLVI